MSESGTDNKSQDLEHTPSHGDGGPPQRETSLPSKDSGGDKAPPTATGKGNDPERQTRTDSAAKKPAETDGASAARASGRDGQLGPGPRTREEQNTKADVNPVPKAAEATPAGAGAAADKARSGGGVDDAKRAVAGLDSPLRVGLGKAGEVVKDFQRGVQMASDKVAAAKAYVADIDKKASANPVYDFAKEYVAKGPSVLGAQGEVTKGAVVAGEAFVKDLKTGRDLTSDDPSVKAAADAAGKEKVRDAYMGSYPVGAEAVRGYVDEKAKGASTQESLLKGLEQGVNVAPFAKAEEHLEKAASEHAKGHDDIALEQVGKAGESFLGDVVKISSIIDGAMGLAGPKPPGPKLDAAKAPEPAAVDPLGKTQEAPKPVDPLGKTQEAPKPVDPLGKTQEAPKATVQGVPEPGAGDAGAAKGPTYGQVRGGPDVTAKGPATEQGPSTTKSPDAGAAKGPTYGQVRGGPDVTAKGPATEQGPSTTKSPDAAPAGPSTARGLGPDAAPAGPSTARGLGPDAAPAGPSTARGLGPDAAPAGPSSPMADSVPGKSPMADSVPGKSPMADSVPGQAKLADPAASVGRGHADGSGVMSDAKWEANFKEMRQLERSGNAYDAKGNPTPQYAQVLRNIEAHIEAKSTGQGSARAPDGQVDPGKTGANSAEPGLKQGGSPGSGPREGESSSLGDNPRGNGEMSNSKFDANLKEMKQLERSGKAYDARGNPTPQYAEVLRKFEDHVEAKSKPAGSGPIDAGVRGGQETGRAATPSGPPDAIGKGPGIEKVPDREDLDPYFTIRRDEEDLDPDFTIRRDEEDLDPDFTIRAERANPDMGFERMGQKGDIAPVFDEGTSARATGSADKSGIERGGPSPEQRDVLGPNGRDRPQLGRDRVTDPVGRDPK